jgi:hypothetical protein
LIIMTASRKALIVVGVLVAVALDLPWAGAVATASGQSISVTAANPPSGEQGALNLPVIINGKGFKNGAKAAFYKSKTTDPGGVNVKSTQFVSSTQLIATIDIADTAALSLFDIQVQNADGRTGKGTELFSVVQKRDSAPVYEAEFVSTKPDTTWVPKIVGDGAGAYPVEMDWAGYSFHMAASVAVNRAIFFQFDNPYPVYGSSFGCEAWGTLAAYDRAVGYPPYALASDKIARPDLTEFTTTYELTYDESLGRWVRIVESVTRRTTNYRYLNLAGMAPGQKSFTMLVIWFRFGGSLDTFYVNFNDTFHRELVPLDNHMNMNGGVVEVERDASGDIWYIRPISNRFPYLGNPSTLIPQYQANHLLYDTQDLKTDPGGNCDLGNFSMPFELKITQVR